MKKAIVYTSVSGNTGLLAKAIEKKLGQVDYVGKPSEEALEADVLYVGSWTIGNSCTEDIKEFLSKLNGKKVFLFVTAGYGNSEAFLKPIIDSVKTHLNDSNELIGEFICQGKVSAPKQEGMAKGNPEKFAQMKPDIDLGANSPTEDDLAKLKALV